MNKDLIFSLAIPLYNEEKNARKVVNELVRALDGVSINYELILVNNGSIDKTHQILEELAKEIPDRIKIVRVPVNQGYGWGIINGLNVASGEFIGYVCGDGQIHPKDIVKVFYCISKGKCDLAKVKRVTRQDGFVRKLLSAGYNSLFFLLFGVRSLDVNGTPKILRRKMFETISPVSKDWFIDAEIMIKAKHLNLRTEEVPVEFLRREGGASHVKFSTVTEFIRNMFNYRFGRGTLEWKGKT